MIRFVFLLCAASMLATCSSAPSSQGSSSGADAKADVAQANAAISADVDPAKGGADSSPLMDTGTLSDATVADAASFQDGPSPMDTQVDVTTKPDSSISNADISPDLTADAAQQICNESQLSDVFQKKIKPLVTKGQPSTCNQCHLSGVDLGMFVQDSPCKSMACMVDKGMVDFKAPAKSSVMKWIDMAKPQSGLITLAVQQKEHDAFLQWITWSSQCQEAVCGKIADPCGAGSATVPVTDTAMLGKCDEKTIGSSFTVLVYKWRDRCSHCHAPYGKDFVKNKAPAWLHSDKTDAGSIYTMYNVLGLPGLPGKPSINVNAPDQSVFLLKPLSPDAGGLGNIHAGGVKFADKNDPAYIDFLKWIQQFAACSNKP